MTSWKKTTTTAVLSPVIEKVTKMSLRERSQFLQDI